MLRIVSNVVVIPASHFVDDIAGRMNDARSPAVAELRAARGHFSKWDSQVFSRRSVADFGAGVSLIVLRYVNTPTLLASMHRRGTVSTLAEEPRTEK